MADIQDTATLELNKLAANARKLSDILLKSGASVLIRSVRQQLLQQLPAASKKNPKYSDTLLSGVMKSKPNGDEIKVHIMGSRKKGSGTFRLRFFENGTKERFQDKVNGKTLAKPRSLGQITGLNFFNTAISSTPEQSITDAMQQAIEKNLKSINII